MSRGRRLRRWRGWLRVGASGSGSNAPVGPPPTTRNESSRSCSAGEMPGNAAAAAGAKRTDGGGDTRTRVRLDTPSRN